MCVKVAMKGGGQCGSCYFPCRYSRQRVAQLTCSFNLNLPGEAHFIGTEGVLKLPQTFWCPSKLETPSVRHTIAV